MSNKLAHTGQLSRADLLRAILSDDAKQVACIAEQLGLHYVPDSPPVTIGGNDAVKPPETEDSNIQQHLVVEDGLRPTAGFWLLASRESHAPSDQQTEPVAVPVTVEWEGRPQQAPRYHLLTTQRDFIPRLLPWLQNVMAGFKPDIGRLVARVSRGEPLHDVPRLPLKALGSVVQVIDDRHTHLIPYWQDHSALRRWVRALHHGTLEQAVLMEGQAVPRSLTASGWQVWRPPVRNGVVVIFSDLGALSLNPHGQVASWLAIGQMLERAGCLAVVFLPCDPGLCDARLKMLFRLETFTDSHLNTPLPSGAERQRQASLLLDAVSPVIRLEPGLLRQMRLAMAQHGQQWQMDTAVESLVWQHGDIQERHSVAASWNRDARKQRLQRFAQLSPEERNTALDVIRQWRQPLVKQIWFEELVGLDADSTDLYAQDFQAASAYFQQLSEQVQSDVFLVSDVETREWLQRVSWRLPEAALENATVGKALQRIKFSVLPEEAEAVDPRNLLPSDAVEKQVVLFQRGESLYLERVLPDAKQPLGVSPLAILRMQHDLVRVEAGQERLGVLMLLGRGKGIDLPQDVAQLTVVSDRETLHVSQIAKPVWADSIGRDAQGLFIEHHCLGNHYRSYWQLPTTEGAGHWQGFPPGNIGTDNYGLYADLTLNNLTQRFRWIEPGTFLMGSPESEAERDDDEVQHQVTLTQGFWLADSTVTQSLWQAVMGKNPSSFTDNANNPVEQVSWNDSQEFIKKLNGLLPGLQAKLPTEAQWEYACRAGTTTPFSFGNNITPEQVNYNGNYSYSNGKKGLYREKTVPVKSLPANPWGLFEMHGNVWEWCQDVWQEKLPASPVIDPEGVAGGDQEAGVERVVRGGSWYDYGRGVRSAIRYRGDPAGRGIDLGFRLALGLELQLVSGAAEPQNKQERTAGTQTGAGGTPRQAGSAPGAVDKAGKFIKGLFDKFRKNP
ncbi:MAG: hypothetical protein BWK73_23315 [Thiothrix lacustris]|uniref:Sulfatase-modifying factor enzyme-like domain-containing protein n=1 Tax=Thiothrix lacustris TaxID=525917 RepID=A0A1Y1QME4_9GAMM|nr:MAG: hypothetical protein BWK73_23315 [Thiothrix lacustris]